MSVEKIGDCTLYQGDCLEILPTQHLNGEERWKNTIATFP